MMGLSLRVFVPKKAAKRFLNARMVFEDANN
jgi:hypothetical protein